MNRIEAKFRELKKEGKKAFIPYITAGDPSLGLTKDIIMSLVRAGADIIEIGIPFSDPLADGPTIQRAVSRSLSSGTSVAKIFKMVRDLRKVTSVPLVFMTYYNIVFNYGVERFVKDSVVLGADGIIVPDLPMEESGELARAADKRDFSLILLAAPTTPAGRFMEIARRSRGFAYYVSLTGVTGAAGADEKKLLAAIRRLAGLTGKPVCVGFGISGPRQAGRIAGAADGIIVGSAIIRTIEKNLSHKVKLVSEVEKFARSIARAVHGS